MFHFENIAQSMCNFYALSHAKHMCIYISQVLIAKNVAYMNKIHNYMNAI